MIKIIHILNHAPLKKHLGLNPSEANKFGPAEFIYLEEKKKYVGFYLGDFHIQLAKFTLEATDEFQIECWRPYTDFIDKCYSKNINGITHRLFPSKQFRIPYFGTFLYSNSMLKELKKEINDNKIIIHFHDGHSRFVTWQMWKLRKTNVPIIYQHRGYAFGNFLFKYSNKKYNIIPLLEFLLFQKPLTKRISYYLAGSQPENSFVKETLKLEKCEYFMDGVLFDKLIPVTNKDNIRNELEIPTDKIIILYVGLFQEVKGIGEFMKVYNRIKEKYKNIQLVTVGGYKTDEYYKLLLDNQVIIRERVPAKILVKYYQASDIYVMPTTDPIVQNFGGFGTAPQEALACNVPVLSYNIINYPGTLEERNKIGRMINTEQETYDNLEYMINHLDEFKEARKYTQKYYDNDIMIDRLVQIYKGLSSEFYGA